MIASLNIWQLIALGTAAIFLVVASAAGLAIFFGWLVHLWRSPSEELIGDFDPERVAFEKVWRDGRWVAQRVAKRPFRAPELKPAPALFIGWQGYPGFDPFELFVLLEPIPGHPIESSVSRQTLEQAGYFVPPAPYPFGAIAEHRDVWAKTKRDEGTAVAP